LISRHLSLSRQHGAAPPEPAFLPLKGEWHILQAGQAQRLGRPGVRERNSQALSPLSVRACRVDHGGTVTSQGGR